MASQDKEYKTIKDQLREGCICSAWGSEYLFSVNPAPGIDKVRISIVKKGTSGKESSDFYMDMDDFRRLCEDIESGVAQKKIGADNAPYPTAYEYVTGENGSKVFSLGGSKKPKTARAQIKIDGKYMCTQVSGSKLRDMAFYYRLVMGMIPCSRYYKTLVDVYWEGIAQREAAHNQN